MAEGKDAADLELRASTCAAAVQAGWVDVRVQVSGGVYLVGVGDGPIRYRSLCGEQHLLLAVPEATGSGEEWRAAASVAGTRWRASGSPPVAGAAELDVVVRICWRLLREEVVTLPGTPARRFLLARIVAEGEETAAVPTRFAAG